MLSTAFSPRERSRPRPFSHGRRCQLYSILPPPGSVYRSEGKPLQFISLLWGGLVRLHTRHNNNSLWPALSPGPPLQTSASLVPKLLFECRAIQSPSWLRPSVLARRRELTILTTRLCGTGTNSNGSNHICQTSSCHRRAIQRGAPHGSQRQDDTTRWCSRLRRTFRRRAANI